MNYELAKQLREAGFPQPKRFEDCVGEKAWGSFGKEDFVYAPSLSELIEACGDKFWRLQRESGGWIVSYIVSEDESGGEFSWIKGKTPNEAVARAWLELNE